MRVKIPHFLFDLIYRYLMPFVLSFYLQNKPCIQDTTFLLRIKVAFCNVDIYLIFGKIDNQKPTLPPNIFGYYHFFVAFIT